MSCGQSQLLSILLLFLAHGVEQHARLLGRHFFRGPFSRSLLLLLLILRLLFPLLLLLLRGVGLLFLLVLLFLFILLLLLVLLLLLILEWRDVQQLSHLKVRQL